MTGKVVTGIGQLKHMVEGHWRSGLGYLPTLHFCLKIVFLPTSFGKFFPIFSNYRQFLMLSTKYLFNI